MDVNRAVADNLKALRERRKLSLDALSQLSGVSKSMLGQIERGEVNPTISVLWKIAGGLKVSFGALIERQDGQFLVVRGAEVQPLREKGGYANFPVFKFDERTHFEQYRIEIEPGCGLVAEAHMPGTEEYITVYEGALTVTAAGATTELGRYDSIRFLADTEHGYHNPGPSRAVLAMTLYYAG